MFYGRVARLAVKVTVLSHHVKRGANSGERVMDNTAAFGEAQRTGGTSLPSRRSLTRSRAFREPL